MKLPTNVTINVEWDGISPFLCNAGDLVELLQNVPPTTPIYVVIDERQDFSHLQVGGDR